MCAILNAGPELELIKGGKSVACLNLDGVEKASECRSSGMFPLFHIFSQPLWWLFAATLT